MAFHITKRSWLVGLVMVGFCLLFRPKKMPVATTVVGQAFLEPSFVLHYSQLPQNTLKSFNLQERMLRPTQRAYITLTDGYLPEPLYQQLLSDVNTYYKAQATTLPPFFYQVSSEGRWKIITFVGDLSHILIQNLETNQIYPLDFLDAQNLGDMYPYHLEITGDTLTLLGGKINSYASMLYTIDLPTGSVQTAYNVPEAPYARIATQSALFSSTYGVFLEEQSLRIVDAVTGLSDHLPLQFTPTGLIASQTQLLVYGNTSEGNLPYSLLDPTLQIVSSGSFALPSSAPHLIQAFLDGAQVTFFTDETDASFYQNYSLTYDLSSGQMIHCIGLESPPHLVLTGVSRAP